MTSDPYRDYNLSERLNIIRAANDYVRAMGVMVDEDNLRYLNPVAARQAVHALLADTPAEDGSHRVLTRLVAQMDADQPPLRNHRAELEALRPGLRAALEQAGWQQQGLAACWDERTTEFRRPTDDAERVQLLIPLQNIAADPTGDGIASMFGYLRAGTVLLAISEDLADGMAICLLQLDAQLDLDLTIQRLSALADSYIPLS